MLWCRGCTKAIRYLGREGKFGWAVPAPRSASSDPNPSSIQMKTETKTVAASAFTTHKMAQISITYAINPPDSLNPGDVPLPRSAKLSHALPAASAESSASPTAAFYAAASIAVRAAQKDLNERLTVWKEAVGDREKDKENVGKVAWGQGRGARMSVKDVSGTGTPTPTEGDSDSSGGEA